MADQAIAKLRYTHDAMIDLIIANPAIKQGQLAHEFGYTQAWVSRIMSSDAFKERLIARRGELVDKGILETLDQRFEAMALRSLAVLEESLEAKPSAEVALKALDLSAKALGYGARKDPMVQVTNYVAVMPPKAEDSKSWIKGHSPYVDVSPTEVESVARTVGQD